MLDTIAKNSPRNRVQHTGHPAPNPPVQRVCVAINPGSYIQPHRHATPTKWELFIVLKGSASILIFDDHATVSEAV